MTATALALPNRFKDVDGKEGLPSKTMYNARIALGLLGVECRYDVFHDRRYVGGHVLGTDVGQVTDDVCLFLRLLCRERFKFDPGKDNMWDAVNLACREGSYHPVLDYLRGLRWDRKERIGTFLIDYMHAPDTPFVRAVSQMVLIASVRRVVDPGCKFDYLTVIESPEGHDKSRALATLYGAENFSDQSILGMTDKELQEAVRGRWGLECADLSGMRRAEVEKIKAQITRQIDRTRPAYGRAVIDAPRSVVFWGTTNDQEYLRSQHGNRRLLPVPVKRIDIEAIKRDRDQLWAEAVVMEELGEPIALAPDLWAAAAAEQDARTAWDPLTELLDEDLSERADEYEKRQTELRALGHDDANPNPVYERDEVAGTERVASRYLMTTVCGFKSSASADDAKRLGTVMRRLGWEGPKGMRIAGRNVKGYERKREPWA